MTPRLPRHCHSTVGVSLVIVGFGGRDGVIEVLARFWAALHHVEQRTGADIGILRVGVGFQNVFVDR